MEKVYVSNSPANMGSPSHGANAPELSNEALKGRGRRECRMLSRTRSLACK
jgi:hypothetical protein